MSSSVEPPGGPNKVIKLWLAVTGLAARAWKRAYRGVWMTYSVGGIERSWAEIGRSGAPPLLESADVKYHTSNETRGEADHTPAASSINEQVLA